MKDTRDPHQIIIAWMAVVCFGLSIALTLLASTLTPDANMIASTISDVAAGPYDWVQDLAFYLLAGALIALAYAMSRLPTCAWHWRGSILTMPLMAIAIAVMAYYQEYGDGDSNENGIVIHIYLVYTLGFSFMALLLLSIPTLVTHHKWWKLLNIVFFIVWTSLSVYYFNMSTAYDGLMERIIATAYLAWLFLLSWRLAIEGGCETSKQAAQATGTASD